MDRRQYSPSSERNKDPILDVLKSRLPAPGTILEIASGSGEHAVHFAPQLPKYTWQPSNYEQDQLDSVMDWVLHVPSDNLCSPVLLDATAAIWPVEKPDYKAPKITGIFNANMIHISPWAVCEGLMAGTGRILEPGGRLYLYGPYKIDGQHTAPSNVKFEHWLKSKSPEFEVRDQQQVIDEARKNGLKHIEAVAMPANNFLQIFEKI